MKYALGPWCCRAIRVPVYAFWQATVLTSPVMAPHILDHRLGGGTVAIDIVGAVVHLKPPLLDVFEAKLQLRVFRVGEVAQVLGFFLRAPVANGADHIKLDDRQGLRVGQHVAPKKCIDVARQGVKA